jgi:hypothetical protein
MPFNTQFSRLILLLGLLFRAFPPTRFDDAGGNVVDGLAGAPGDYRSDARTV